MLDEHPLVCLMISEMTLCIWAVLQNDEDVGDVWLRFSGPKREKVGADCDSFRDQEINSNNID